MPTFKHLGTDVSMSAGCLTSHVRDDTHGVRKDVASMVEGVEICPDING